MRKIHAVTLAGILALVLTLGSDPAARSAPVPQPAFSTFPDGSVFAGGELYPSRSAFHRSDYFRQNGLRCGTQPPDNLPDTLDGPLASTTDCTTGQTIIQSEYWLTRAYVIPVVFHIITAANGTTGNLTDQRIRDQVEVMNQDFRAMAGTMGSLGNDTMIQFELAGITRTADDAWYADSDESGYKTALSWDQQKYLNIYTNTASGYLGYSYLPQMYAGTWRDGVVLSHDYVGGRNLSGVGEYDQGRTAVHEVGHYLGLDHTFAGGCTNTFTTGDLIVDTNAEYEEHYGCSQVDSCGTADPIHNYMNYTDDSCMQEFTSQQANRLVCSLVNYRPELYRVRTTLAVPLLPLMATP